MEPGNTCHSLSLKAFQLGARSKSCLWYVSVVVLVLWLFPWNCETQSARYKGLRNHDVIYKLKREVKRHGNYNDREALVTAPRRPQQVNEMMKKSVKNEYELRKKSVKKEELTKKNLKKEDDLMGTSVEKEELTKKNLKKEDDLIGKSVEKEELTKKNLKRDDELRKKNLKKEDELMKKTENKEEEELTNNNIKKNEELIKKSMKKEEELMKKSVKKEEKFTKNTVSKNDELTKWSVKIEDELTKYIVNKDKELMKDNVKNEEDLTNKSVKTEEEFTKKKVKREVETETRREVGNKTISSRSISSEVMAELKKFLEHLEKAVGQEIKEIIINTYFAHKEGSFSKSREAIVRKSTLSNPNRFFIELDDQEDHELKEVHLKTIFLPKPKKNIRKHKTVGTDSSTQSKDMTLPTVTDRLDKIQTTEDKYNVISSEPTKSPIVITDGEKIQTVKTTDEMEPKSDTTLEVESVTTQLPLVTDRGVKTQTTQTTGVKTSKAQQYKFVRELENLAKQKFDELISSYIFLKRNTTLEHGKTTDKDNGKTKNAGQMNTTSLGVFLEKLVETKTHEEKTKFLQGLEEYAKVKINKFFDTNDFLKNYTAKGSRGQQNKFVLKLNRAANKEIKDIIFRSYVYETFKLKTTMTVKPTVVTTLGKRRFEASTTEDEDEVEGVYFLIN